jgi:D-sedoheptulose 7-phosphate isomerase
METDVVIRRSACESQKIMAFVVSDEAIDFMTKVTTAIASAFKAGKKVLIAGNGGSLCDAAHFAEELTGCFRKKRQALPALVLSEMGHLSCVANDFGFEEVFSRGIEAFGSQGDLFIALSTSGNSPNIIKAAQTAKDRGLTTVFLLGKKGGALASKGDFTLIVPQAKFSDRIQEVHMACLHIIIEGLENELFYKN